MNREIREHRKLSGEQIQTYSVVRVRVFSVFRGLKKFLGEALGALFALKFPSFSGKFMDAFGVRLEAQLCV